MKVYEYTIGWRKGLLVEENGNWGEIAPLPQRLNDPLAAVCFGLESVRSPYRPCSVPLCALLMGTPKEILQRAEVAAKEGMTTAKVKLGTLTPQEAFPLVSTLSKGFRLRIDLNRMWSMQQTLAFFSHFDQNAFDYIEDPLDHEQFTHPFALDEKLALSSNPLLKAFVIKPSVVGTHLLPYLEWAKKQKIQVILSSSFESGIGIAQIASLACRYGLNAYPLGLDTLRYMEEDLLEEPCRIEKGILYTPSTLRPKREKLRAVSLH